MPNVIQLKRSATAAAIPAAGSLVAGELAVNTADGKLYMKKDNATVVEIGAGGGGGGSTSAADTAISVDSNVMYSTVSSTLGVVPSYQLVQPTTETAITQTTALQRIFTAAGASVFAVKANTHYRFELNVGIRSTQASHNFLYLAFDSTAYGTTARFYTVGRNFVPAYGQGSNHQTFSVFETYEEYACQTAGGQAATLAMVTLNANVIVRWFKCVGSFRTAAIAGNFIPKVQMNANPTMVPILLTGSYFAYWPIGAASAQKVGSLIS